MSFTNCLKNNSLFLCAAAIGILNLACYDVCAEPKSRALTNFQLTDGESVKFSSFTLKLQKDGNLVLKQSGTTLWNSKITGRSCRNNCTAIMQGDGNLVLYQNQQPYWATHTEGNRNAALRTSTMAPYLSIVSPKGTLWSAGQRQNWFAPLDPFGNYVDRHGVRDFMSLFAPGSPWQNVLSHIDVFALYSQMVVSAPDDQLRAVFSFLKANSIALALEVGVLDRSFGGGDGGSCGIDTNGNCIEGMDGSAAYARQLATRIKNLGGELTYVAMDEPFFYGHTDQRPGACQYPINTLASNAAATFLGFREIFPLVQIGDVEPIVAMPVGWETDYKDWIVAFQKAIGARLAFFHDDSDVDSLQWQSRFPVISNILADQQIPYGFIRKGSGDSSSNTEWNATALGYSRLYRELQLPPPDQEIFQTWNLYPDHALPESDPTSFTFYINASLPTWLHASIKTSQLNIYRLYRPTTGHFLDSQSETEGAAAGYSSQGLAYKLFADDQPLRRALYRCWSRYSGDHMLSTDKNCEGYDSDGLIGYAENFASTIASQALFRCFKDGRHFQTLNALECKKNGFAIEGFLGFTP